MSGFTKLWSEITDSSIWNEDDKTRIVWITMLARQGPDNVVRASVGGLAHLARVTREDCEKALDKLSSPDPDSRSSFAEGRRIEKIEGGFFIINGDHYRQRRGDEERKEYMRKYMKEYRRKKQSKHNVNTVKPCQEKLAQEEEEAEEEAEEVSLSLTREEQEREKRLDQELAENAVANGSSIAETPTIEEVMREAEMRGIPREHATSFFEYNEGQQLWQNRNGKPINWRMSLKSWSERRRTMKPGQTNGKTGYKKIEI